MVILEIIQKTSRRSLEVTVIKLQIRKEKWSFM